MCGHPPYALVQTLTKSLNHEKYMRHQFVHTVPWCTGKRQQAGDIYCSKGPGESPGPLYSEYNTAANVAIMPMHYMYIHLGQTMVQMLRLTAFLNCSTFLFIRLKSVHP